MTRVTLAGLTKVYPGGEAPAVDRLDLEIEPGRLTALLGPSGCGKTTTMKMIAGLLEPSSGDIAFDGRSVLGIRAERRGAVMVFQNHLLFPYMSVASNVGFGLRMRGLPAAEIESRVAEMLDRVRLPDMGARRPSGLSGGQQQRVALARALVVRPDVLLLDEPLSNLDAHLRLEMRDLILSLQRETGVTTIVVTHDQEEAVVLADRIALILDGRLAQFGAPERFFERPASEAVARFFGARNFVPGRVVRSGGAVRFASLLGEFDLPPASALPEGEGLLTVRPESVRLAAAGDAAAHGPGHHTGGHDTGDGVNARWARVAERLYLGTQTRLRLLVEGEGGAQSAIEAVARPAEAAGIAVGDRLRIVLPPEALWVLPPEG